MDVDRLAAPRGGRCGPRAHTRPLPRDAHWRDRVQVARRTSGRRPARHVEQVQEHRPHAVGLMNGSPTSGPSQPLWCLTSRFRLATGWGGRACVAHHRGQRRPSLFQTTVQRSLIERVPPCAWIVRFAVRDERPRPTASYPCRQEDQIGLVPLIYEADAHARRDVARRRPAPGPCFRQNGR